MNWKFVISAVVMFIMSWALGFLFHGVLLHGDYAKFPNLMRTMADAQTKLPYMLLAHLCLALGFTWIYLKGKEDKPWLAQGVRYGIAVSVMMVFSLYLIYYAVMPFALDLVIKQIVYDTIRILLMAIVLAWINR
jgi:cytochrome bd-type quinol oxidase subunit 2